MGQSFVAQTPYGLDKISKSNASKAVCSAPSSVQSRDATLNQAEI